MEAGKDDADARDESEATNRCRTPPTARQAAVGHLGSGDGGQKQHKPPPSTAPVVVAAPVAVTLGSLPDEVLAMLLGFCDARTRMMMAGLRLSGPERSARTERTAVEPV